MNFLAPVMLALAALLPVIVLLYFLKLKRVERPISSTYLWQQAIQDLHVNAPFQRLRKNLLLLLQLLLAGVLVLALARPAMDMAAVTGRQYICLIDTSASMGATDVSPNRLEHAKREALRLLGDMGRGDQMMIATFDARPSVVVSWTSVKSRLRDAIKGLRVRQTSTDFEKAVRLVDAMAAGVEDAHLYLMSDGAFAPVDEDDAPDVTLHYVKCGAGAENAGITAIDARRGIEDLAQPQVFARASNFAATGRAARMDLSSDDRLLDARDVSLPADGSAAAVFADTTPTEGLVKVTLSGHDDLAADDVAWLDIASPRRLRTLVVSSGNYFLELAIQHDPFCDPVLMTGEAFDAALADGSFRSDDYDLVVFDRCAPQTLPPGAYLFFGALPPLTDFGVAEEVTEPVVIDWDALHPVNQYVQYGNLFLASAVSLAAPSDAHTLVESDAGPLVVWWSSPTHRVIVVGFDLFESRWPLRPSFPIFLANVIRYFGAAQLGAQAQSVRPGGIITFAVPPGTSDVGVTTPDGQQQSLEVRAAAVTFGDTDTCGPYVFRIGEDLRRVFAVNLTDARESDITPADEIAWGGVAVPAAARALKENREIWKWLALAALGALMLEWYVYNRRGYL